MGQYHHLTAALIVGGKDYHFEKSRIDQCNIMICTPGRLLQHMDVNPLFDCVSMQVNNLANFKYNLWYYFVQCYRNIIFTDFSFRRSWQMSWYGFWERYECYYWKFARRQTNTAVFSHTNRVIFWIRNYSINCINLLCILIFLFQLQFSQRFSKVEFKRLRTCICTWTCKTRNTRRSTTELHSL